MESEHKAENSVPEGDALSSHSGERTGEQPGTLDRDRSATADGPSGAEAEAGVLIWAGSCLDWSSPKVDVQLYVELPFWLMTPDGVFDVTHEATTLKVEVVNDCEEGQVTTRHLKNHTSTVFIRRPGEEPPSAINELIRASREGCSFRVCRTMLVFQTKVLRSVLEAVRGTHLQQTHAAMYLTSMAVGHLPFANALITAYRRASYDPFVQDVTEATVPTWFVRWGDEFIRASVYPYCDHEYRPHLPTPDGGEVPLNLATRESVVTFLATSETPGEAILLDAWSYYYSGRFGDSIRALVTAIEVLLEAKVAELLRAKGRNDGEVVAALKATATKFLTRLNEYVQLSGRTIPGPQLSWVYYVNGVRLRQELIDTRELRHRIVHGGHRMDPHAYGSMQRALETMTGLFGWLDGDEQSAARRFSNYQLKSGLRGRVVFCVDYTADGADVAEWLPPGVQAEDLPLVDDLNWGRYVNALHGEHKDLELFVKMSLACIILASANIVAVLAQAQRGLIEDRDLQKPGPGVVGERFTWTDAGVTTAAFIIEVDGLVSATDLTGVMVRLLQLRVEVNGRVHGLCVVNQQRHLEPSRREACLALKEDLDGLLKSCDLTLVFAADLAWYVLGARDHGWSLADLRARVGQSGYCACEPPGATVAGEVIKPFPRHNALGVSVRAPLPEGCGIYVRSERGFKAMSVESIEVDRERVNIVSQGLAGVKFTGDVSDVIEGSFVFRVDSAPLPTRSECADAGDYTSRG